MPTIASTTVIAAKVTNRSALKRGRASGAASNWTHGAAPGDHPRRIDLLQSAPDLGHNALRIGPRSHRQGHWHRGVGLLMGT